MVESGHSTLALLLQVHLRPAAPGQDAFPTQDADCGKVRSECERWQSHSPDLYTCLMDLSCQRCLFWFPFKWELELQIKRQGSAMLKGSTVQCVLSLVWVPVGALPLWAERPHPTVCALWGLGVLIEWVCEKLLEHARCAEWALPLGSGMGLVHPGGDLHRGILRPEEGKWFVTVRLASSGWELSAPSYCPDFSLLSLLFLLSF